MDTRPQALVVRPEQAEHVPFPGGGGFRLLADGSDTGGALGANLLTLAAGADGARPHHHSRSTELFHVLEGSVQFLIGERAETVPAGGLVVVPPGLVHAFGAGADRGAELLAVLTPGVDRFEYFRTLGRIRAGRADFDGLLPHQDRYDVHFADPEPWLRLRGA